MRLMVRPSPPMNRLFTFEAASFGALKNFLVFFWQKFLENAPEVDTSDYADQVGKEKGYP